MLYYHTPPGGILAHTETELTTEATEQANTIAKAFAACRCPVSLAQVVTAPQLITYHFNLSSLKDFAKVKRILPTVAAACHSEVVQTVSTVADFAIILPRQARQIVPLESVINSGEFARAVGTLPAAVGVSSDNKPIIIDIDKMPHLLIAGTTGSGKSVLLNTLICSLLFKATPNRCRLLFIDLKRVETAIYKDLPHLLAPIANEYKTALQNVKGLYNLMQMRFATFERLGVKSIHETQLPHIILVIDELAELMQTDEGEEVETYLNRLAALGRAAGIHLVVATQRPTRQVVPGLLSANIPGKIALKVSSTRESVIILDHKGAETLTGWGDALLKTPDKVTETRLQGCFTSASDAAAVVEWWKTKGQTNE